MIVHDRTRLMGQSPIKSRTPANAGVLDLFNIAGPAHTGEFLLHLGLVLPLVGDELAVVNLGEAREAQLVLLFADSLIGSEPVDVVGAREEGEPADDVPVLLNPVDDANPL